MDFTAGGDPTKASAYYPNYNAFAFTPWCTVDPGDLEYWMRVSAADDLPPAARYVISDGTYPRALDTPFQILGQVISPNDVLVDRDGNIINGRDGNYIYPRDAVIVTSLDGPYVTVHTFGDVAPIVRIGVFQIDICKDLDGSPDGNWASRIVTLEARFNG